MATWLGKFNHLTNEYNHHPEAQETALETKRCEMCWENNVAKRPLDKHIAVLFK